MKVVLLISLVSHYANAAGGELHYIPWNELIIPQAVNVTIFFTLLFILLRKPIKNHFSGKVEDFEKAKKDAAVAKEQAVATHDEVKMKLEELKTSADQNLKAAHADADALKLKIIDEAKSHADRLEKEARLSAEHELQKAMFSLRTELLNKSVDVARDEVKTNTDSSIEASLQKEFVEKAKEVRL